MKQFKEEQRFTQPWLIILMTVTSIAPIVIITNLFLKSNNMSTKQYIIALSTILLGFGLVFIFKLTTQIDKIGIHYKFFPLHLKMKTISWSDIKHAETRTYNALSEYGGWGLKGGFLWNQAKGKAINVKGDIGVQLTLNNNKKLLIGTQQKNQVDSVIATYLHQK
ncbi:hypothetical protein [Algibacter pectinivorans]|uniref:PH domain-containing protein n=1 Tax=Algibacter pectinivorans TaxID=870482 RepID=A0A1I1P5Y3_9FLAO|nr:hypothetical protein [Algibacter pectinivorans]SFD03068.1 hypothetical protein SAMN04487987_10354 [Algibacter pectinivorans]